MADKLTRPVLLYFAFLLLVLITLTLLALYLIIYTSTQIQSISFSFSQIPGRNETTSKMDSLVDSYQSYGDIIASNFSQREPTFDKLHDDLFELMKEINKKFYPSSVLLEKTEANFKKNFPIVYAQANDAKDFCDKAFKGSNELETQVAALIADLMSTTLLDGINKKLQEDILPSNMTFLTGLNFQLNSFLKFRKAKQIDGGDYLAKSSNLETDYFPETDFTKIKLTSYATVNGSFLLDPPGTPGLGNSIVSTQGTLPANISFPRDLSAFTVYAQEIIPSIDWQFGSYEHEKDAITRYCTVRLFDSR